MLYATVTHMRVPTANQSRLRRWRTRATGASSRSMAVTPTTVQDSCWKDGRAAANSARTMASPAKPGCSRTVRSNSRA